jgi:exopolyphosphatase/guanosine-5'-triphosphate,3'-diphosphate pyrophosphatase
MYSTAASGSWAALDLGSNSFHLLLVEPVGGSFITRERLKEKVQLLAGFRDGQIAAGAQARGLACLARFAQRLKPLPAERLLVMGTFALRQADNALSFARAAEQVLNAPVQVISGEYEAQLIYAAVAHQLGPGTASRLVMDIGGGSTEIAVGSGASAELTLSVNIGCVAFKDQFFAAGDHALGYREAKAAALAAIRAQMAAGGFPPAFESWWGQAVYGTSGTLESIQTVLNANGWSRGRITREALARLEAAIIDEHWVIDAGLPGLAPDRTDIFPSGVAILSACFDALDIEQCEYVDVSLLQGMICEHVVTANEADLREDSVQQLAQRFNVEPAQAARVSRCALALFDASGAWWQDDSYRNLLRWAAQLHELGVHISARHYHRHGAYIVKHAELPGFNDEQQGLLALLIRGHRRSMPGLAFRAFDPDIAQQLLRLVALLRLAVILERSHHDAESPQVSLQVQGNRLELDCGPGWLASHPLSLRELQVEVGQQRTAGIELVLLNAPEA